MKSVEIQGFIVCWREKRAKILDAGLKWRNQGVGRDCREGTTKMGERGGRRLGHAPTRVTAIEEKSHA